MPSFWLSLKNIPFLTIAEPIIPQLTKVKTFHFFLFCLLLIGLTIECNGQKEKKFKKGGLVRLGDSLVSYSQSDIFQFPNVNKTTYYHDASKLKQIRGLDKPDTQEGMYKALKEYIKNFGIQNFSKSTPMLWKLAQLSEKYGPKGEAVLLYKLVLKHHQQGIDIKEVYKQYQLIDTEKKRKLRSA
ncbi:MAG: hypothetical protein ACKVOQ_01305 [Cyclobacteriaceae bacterium]